MGPVAGFRSALAVVAHPDDESFGLGAVLSRLVAGGPRVAGLCFTHGEASTLGGTLGDLHQVRADELADAARALGMARWELLDHPDGHLDRVPAAVLAGHVVAMARAEHTDLLLVFDEEGITGHPDHRSATRAALAAADELDLPVLAWAVPERVAEALNAEFGVAFRGRPEPQVHVMMTVDRARQLAAVACHRSQSEHNPVLWRRLELTGDREPLRWLRGRPRRTTD